MKLYVFRPQGHGQLTLSVVAEDEHKAKEIIDSHIKEMYLKNGKFEYEVMGWGTNYYQCEIYKIGEVSENNND